MRTRYDHDDDDRLCEMVNDGAMTRDAIIAIGVPGYTLRNRAKKITAGNNLRYTIPRPWAPNETSKLRDMLDEGISAAEISVRLARSLTCIHWHIKMETDPSALVQMREQRKRHEKNRKLLPASSSVELTPRICPTCGKNFIPEVGAQQRVYCSYACRVMGYKTNGAYHNRPTHRFNCAHCGKLVEAYGDDRRQKFCSAHCEKLYWKHPRKKIGGIEE